MSVQDYSENAGTSSGNQNHIVNNARPAAEKFAKWKTLSVSERLDRIGGSIQKVRDTPYWSADYRCEPKFQKGDPVCLCCEGLYYHAVIQDVHKDPFYCPELKKNVPLYTVKYPGWNERSKDEEVVEYDVIGTTRHTIAHELLYAHYWNQYKIKSMRKISKQQQKSVFTLPERTLQKLDKKWTEQIKRENPTEDGMTFAQWTGQ